ncbi:MAG: SMC-Scp complex subunit ScpB [Myxococcaceae bacterium]|nr:SMC-Scp complex subunit ScpB [Myxococcaceae bacterium]MCI0669064.1 SMC-Scp complex subunit ScpB [Myxococcaceae bacterium]
MTTGKRRRDEAGVEVESVHGGPGPFSEEEIAAVTGPSDASELDDVDAAVIDVDDRSPELESSFEKLVARSRRLSPERIRTVLQSLLFVSDKALTVDQLFEATGIDREQIEGALNAISGSLREGISGIVLHEVAGGWQLRTDPGSAEYVRRFLRVKPQRLTRSAVETLAIIAYRQPVTRPEIEEIRGVDSGAVLKALLDRKLIKILGKKEELGRPILYGTTREFLEFFGLRDLAALPTLREFQELTQEHQEIVEKETAPQPGAAGTVAALADPAFTKKLERSQRDSEAALEALEAAMTSAEKSSKDVAAALGTSQPPRNEGADEGP